MVAVARELGGYEVLAKLKAGGMATLYLGRRKGVAGFSRLVAIKFVHEHLAEDQDFVRMFVNEALLQSRITHPNVVHVEELGELEGQHFLVMEYVHGCALSQLLRTLARRDRALSPELAVYIAMQIAAGLHAAHELRDEHGKSLGVVHRDVSPDNVLLAYEGHVKLIDFGVAKVEASVQKTSAGTLKGKLRYMSPEQANGRSVDRRTDVYALSIVLWEMLTMRRLFHEPDQLLLLDLVRAPRVPPPSSVRAGIPPALEAVVMKALSIDPAARYANTQEMRRALAEALPSALLTEPTQLAGLLSATMSAEIAKERARLPSTVSSVLGTPTFEAGETEVALETMTITVEGLAYLAEGGKQTLSPSQEVFAPTSSSQPSVSGARPIAPPPLPSSIGPITALDLRGPATPAVVMADSSGSASFAPLSSAPSSVSASVEAPSKGRSPLVWVGVAAAAIGVVLASGLAAYVVRTSSSASTDVIRVTPLAPAPTTVPAAQLAPPPVPPPTTPTIPTPPPATTPTEASSTTVAHEVTPPPTTPPGTTSQAAATVATPPHTTTTTHGGAHPATEPVRPPHGTSMRERRAGPITTEF